MALILAVLGCFASQAITHPWQLLLCHLGIGLATVLLGLAGFAFISHFWVGQRRWHPALLLIMPLLILAPLAILFAVIFVFAPYWVDLSNHHAQAVTQIRIHGGGVDLACGDLAPGASLSRVFWIQGDGTLKMEAKIGGRLIEEEIDGYVTSGVGGDLEIEMDDKGVLKVCSESGRDL
jgi:hypothetical protein